MRLFLCCLFISFVLPVKTFAQTVYDLSHISAYHNDEVIYDLSGKPFSGRLEFYMDDTASRMKLSAVFSGISQHRDTRYKTKISAGYKNGLKEGKWYRYEDDVLTEEFDFKNGLLNGVSIQYDNTKIGEIREKIQYKDHICIEAVSYSKGKPRSGYKTKEEVLQKRKSQFLRIRGKPIECDRKNSILLAYHPTGAIYIEKDPQKKTTIWYFEDGNRMADAKPTPEEQKENADILFTAYYEDGRPMLVLLVKGEKAVGGEYYDKIGQKTVLDEASATDYLLDFALSYVLRGDL